MAIELAPLGYYASIRHATDLCGDTHYFPHARGIGFRGLRSTYDPLWSASASHHGCSLAPFFIYVARRKP